MKIQQFKKGDIITRIQRSSITGDRSYMGEKIIFVGIANNQIYYFLLEYKYIGVNKLRNVELKDWEDGWDYYTEPNTLINYDFLDSLDIKFLENYIRNKKLKNIDNAR
jgi:hypothetical protein